MMAQYLVDLTTFERELGEHVVEAERVLIEASKIATSSADAYKKAGVVQETLSYEEVEDQLVKLEVDVTGADQRLLPLLRRMKQRIKDSLPNLENRRLPQQEVNKLMHTMNTMKSSILLAVDKIRALSKNLKNKALGRMYDSAEEEEKDKAKAYGFGAPGSDGSGVVGSTDTKNL